MDISRIDPNFAFPNCVNRPGIAWYDGGKEPFVCYGASSVNPYRRMPEEVADKVSYGVSVLAANTAGIRLRFATDSPYVAIHAEWHNHCRMPHMAFTGISGFDLYTEEEDGNYCFVQAVYRPPVDQAKGYESIIDLPSGRKMRQFILNFPLYNDVDALYIGLDGESKFEIPLTYDNEKPVVFYGSSITQGGCASRPGNCYQNFLSRALRMDYVNLGFSGSAKGEDAMIAYLASLDMCAFVSDYDYNAPDAQHLRNTHYKLYEAIRAAHPDIPYIMISKPDFKGDEYGDQDSARRAVIMDSYLKALEAGDQQVYFIDGASFFAGPHADSCTVDGAHPNDLGFYRMAQGIEPVLRGARKQGGR